ncbi:deuterosome assembly protein 1 isoform X5 [Mus musculus]|uniref:Isoform 2 of Deuterosome assembly protein 1 n=2 Tax=Mus musculus TaxID=10090 RepID=Q7M6Y5-2|nr:deuterosome assembly protein 1 isoform 5 [Mus musculus]XP_036010753.1 deuterosome assembly protein 1 isoform X5 [Mus musculus]EDL25033.1 coiled-coil domain containing 67 [Mus musculus]|eukprot:NP_861537.2 deuterosome assembly protein 1 [Mus musculus]
MENQAHTTAGASPCEAELQELMEQIDIMVSNKKLDWERKMRALETRLDLRDQELANAQTCLDQKGQEVGLLRQKLDSLEKCNLVMTQNYEGQLQTLKAQFSKLTSNFEKLRLHQMKQNQIHRKESSSKEELPFELSSLNQKLEEFRAKSREWDKQEVLYQTHLVSLDAQQKLLSEKCSQFQKQAQNYQTQLNGKKQCAEDSSSEIPRLVCESDPGCEATQRDEFIIEKLKSAVSEIALSRNKLQDENQKLLQELKMYQRQCQAMEAGLSEVKSELQSRDDLLRIIEMERLHLHRELLRMGEVQTAQDNRKRVESSYSPSPKEAERKRKELFPMVSDQPNHEKELSKAVDLSNKKHSQCTSINKLEYENERLRSDLAKLHGNGKAAWPNQSSYGEAGAYVFQSQLKTETSGDRISQDCELNRSPTPLSPLPFQTKEMASPLVGDNEVLALSPPDISFRASLAAQHFLMEEERRAKELEKLLNTHIDELQRHTEFTLNKYTKLKQSRHI